MIIRYEAGTRPTWRAGKVDEDWPTLEQVSQAMLPKNYRPFYLPTRFPKQNNPSLLTIRMFDTNENCTSRKRFRCKKKKGEVIYTRQCYGHRQGV